MHLQELYSASPDEEGLGALLPKQKQAWGSGFSWHMAHRGHPCWLYVPLQIKLHEPEDAALCRLRYPDVLQSTGICHQTPTSSFQSIPTLPFLQHDDEGRSFFQIIWVLMRSCWCLKTQPSFMEIFGFWWAGGTSIFRGKGYRTGLVKKHQKAVRVENSPV